jgi:hypothetical protein
MESEQTEKKLDGGKVYPPDKDVDQAVVAYLK